MAIPVIPLPADRLAGHRPAARAEQRPIERDGVAPGRTEATATDSFELPDRSERVSATVTRLDDHLAQRRPNHRVTAEPSRPPPPVTPRELPAQAPPEPGPTDAAQRIAQIVGRTANLAFQAQVIAHSTPGPSSPSTGGQSSQRLAEAASAAYLRRQGTQDTAPLIEPHRPVDLVI